MKLLYIQLGLKPTLNTFSFSSNHTQGDIFDFSQVVAIVSCCRIQIAE